MSSSDTLPTYRGVLNDTTWTDASALAFPTDAIVGVYVQAFTPIVTLDSNYLSLVWSATSTNAPYTHGTLDVDYTTTATATTVPINRQLNWANLVRSFIHSSSPITFSSVTAGTPYTEIGFSWPTLTQDQLVVGDATSGLKTLGIGTAHQFLYGGGASPGWQQVAWTDLLGVPSWLNDTYAQYGVTYATSATSMGTTAVGSAGQFLRSGAGSAAPSFRQVDMANLSGISWGSGLKKVAYTPDSAGKTISFTNAVAASKYLGYSAGDPAFVTIPYSDLSGTPTIPTITQASANQVIVTGGPAYTLSTPQDIATSSSPTFAGLTLSGLTATTALYADASKVITSVPKNTSTTNKYLQQTSSAAPTFVQVACSDLSGTLPIGSGGTNKTSWTQYALLYADTTASLAQLGLGTSGYVLTSTGASSAPSFQALPTAVTIAATANQTTVSGGPAYTVGTVQDIAVTSDVRFGYLNIGDIRHSNWANVVMNSITLPAGTPGYGWVHEPTLQRGDATQLTGWYSYPTYSVGATTGGTVYNVYLDSGAKSGAGSIATAYNLYIVAPLSTTGNGVALYCDSIGVGNGAWAGSATASGTMKISRVGIGMNPDATKVLVATGDSALTGALSVSGTITASGLSGATSLVATDGSKNLTTTTSSCTPTLAGINLGDTTLTKYKEVTGATLTLSYYNSTATITYDYVIVGKIVHMNIREVSFTTGASSAAANSSALPTEVRPARQQDIVTCVMNDSVPRQYPANSNIATSGVIGFGSDNYNYTFTLSTAYRVGGCFCYSLL